MPRHIKIGLVILGIGLAVSLGFFVNIVGRVRSLVNEREGAENPFAPPPPPLYKPSDPPMSVKIFFPTQGGATLLEAENATIFKSAELLNQARQILQKLQDGPASASLDPALPKETKVEELFISGKGTLFADFNNAISANHPGGILNEQATIYAVVNSILYNLPEIQDVKILIGGGERETLAGHCLILLPLQMDLSLTNVQAPEEHAVAEKQ